MIKKSSIFLISVILLTLAYMVENIDYFTPIRKVLQDRTLPSPLLNFGKRGQIMSKLGLKYIVPADNIAAEQNDNNASYIKIDSSRFVYRDNWTEAEKLSTNILPSSAVILKSGLLNDSPIISLFISKENLYNESTGIFKNYTKKGRNWERLCFISYFDKGKLLFATRAGVRLHGGSSRRHSVKNFRLYFRPVYGSSEFKKNLIFNASCEPIKHLIIKKADSRYAFVNSLAYEISREIGCYAPYTKPVKL